MIKGLLNLIRREVGDGYPTVININYNWMWGSVSGIFLVVQIVTGILLAMHYVANVDIAFYSLEHIERDVNYGWFLRFMHANGASFFFVALYLHIAKNIYFKLYISSPKVWYSGLVIFILSMATAFIGYVLPWGQMSFWGATVITNLFSAIPVVGKHLVYWLWSGFSVDNPTLNKFFSLHYVLPFVILALVIGHLYFLHKGNSSNPLGVLVTDRIAFHPYIVLKDLIGVIGVLLVYFTLVLRNSNLLGHSDNYIQANSMVTPGHIVPEWYFLPFYAILRAVPDKLGGVICMFAALLILFLLPFIDKDLYYSSRFSFTNILFFSIFSITMLILGWLGGQPAEYPYTTCSVIFTILYFAYFLFVLPIQKKINDFLLKKHLLNLGQFRGNDLPLPWQVEFQDSASAQMEGITDLYSDVMTFITGIMFFVLWMFWNTLYYWSFNYNLGTKTYYNNLSIGSSTAIPPKESRILGTAFSILPAKWKFFNIHVALEIIWTLIPALILVIIAIPSFSLLFALDDPIMSSATDYYVVVIGAQWYWIYQFLKAADSEPSQGENPLNYLLNVDSDFHWRSSTNEFNKSTEEASDTLYPQLAETTFESRMITDDSLQPDDLRLLTVDNWLTFPHKNTVTFLISSQDVLHSWAVPALGIKVDACPGRLSVVTIYLKRSGLFYGQCSEICGVNHAFMPIMIEVTGDLQTDIEGFLGTPAEGYSKEYNYNETNNSPRYFF